MLYNIVINIIFLEYLNKINETFKNILKLITVSIQIINYVKTNNVKILIELTEPTLIIVSL